MYTIHYYAMQDVTLLLWPTHLQNIHSGNSINCIYIKGTMWWTLRWSNLGGGSSNCASTSIMSIIWAINSNSPEYPWKPPIKPTWQRKYFPLFFFVNHWRGGMSKVKNLRHKLFISSSYFLRINSQLWKCNQKQF